MTDTPFYIALDDRMFRIWEKTEAVALSLYTVSDGWVDRRPINAPHIVRRMRDELLELACRMDDIARDIEADDKQSATDRQALQKEYAETFATIERDKTNDRLGEIVRASRKPPPEPQS
jgi:hypothetical protein